MTRARSWKDVWLGAAALAALVASAAAVFVFARVGALHGKTVRYYAVTPHARGILPGSEVWLGGQKVGLVRDVGFRPATTDTLLRVLLAFDVLDEYQTAIGKTAPVAIRPGSSLIGSPVLAISQRAPGAPRAQAGDTLIADPGSEFDGIRTRLTTTLGTEVPVLLDNVRVLGAQLRATRGTLGALGIEGPGRIASTTRAASGLMARATHGRGTTGLALGQRELTVRAHAVLTRVEHIRARAAAPNSTVGRVRNDSTLLRTATQISADLAAVQALLDEPRGTAGRVLHDRALQLELARAREELEAVIADLKANPLRYVVP